MISKINESAPPDPKIEKWIISNKDRFEKQYGKKAKEVLYATAWKMYNDKKLNEAKMDRAQMPQIKIKDYKVLEQYLSDCGVEWEYTSRLTKDLKFVQDVSEDGINAMKSRTEVLDKPIIIAKDGTIVDGNHRAHVNGLMGRRNRTLMIRRPFNEVHELLVNFDKVGFRDGQNKPIK